MRYRCFLVPAALSLAALIAPLRCDTPTISAWITKGQPVRIMPVGDSITEGKYVNGGYRKPLYQMLKATGYVVTFVGKEDNGDPANKTGFSDGMENPQHEGYGSAPVGAFLSGMSLETHQVLPIGTAVASGHPDVLLVMLGTNDLIYHQKPDATADLMQKVIDAAYAQAPNVTILVASIPPLADPTSLVDAYNALLKQLVAKESASHKIGFADIHSVFGPGDFGADKIHPSQAGYNKMAALWYSVLTGQPAPAVSQ